MSMGRRIPVIAVAAQIADLTILRVDGNAGISPMGLEFFLRIIALVRLPHSLCIVLARLMPCSHTHPTCNGVTPGRKLTASARG